VIVVILLARAAVPHRFPYASQCGFLGSGRTRNDTESLDLVGALGGIRTPDPQIRSLVLTRNRQFFRVGQKAHGLLHLIDTRPLRGGRRHRCDCASGAVRTTFENYEDGELYSMSEFSKICADCECGPYFLKSIRSGLTLPELANRLSAGALQTRPPACFGCLLRPLRGRGLRAGPGRRRKREVRSPLRAWPALPFALLVSEAGPPNTRREGLLRWNAWPRPTSRASQCLQQLYNASTFRNAQTSDSLQK
jgi:hypothetical protein